MLLSTLLVLASVKPCTQFPLVPKTSWTYRAEVAWTPVGSSLVRRRTVTWTTTLVTVERSDSVTVATVRDWPTGLAWWEPDQPSTISLLLCQAGRVYHIPATTGDIRALVDSLLSRSRPPSLNELILQLPLHTGDLFGRDHGDRHDTLYAWYVESATPPSNDVQRLQPGLRDSVYTLIYRTVPDHQRIRFLPGLGITAYLYNHHGTVAEADAVLIAYTRGRL